MYACAPVCACAPACLRAPACACAHVCACAPVLSLKGETESSPPNEPYNYLGLIVYGPS